jgi:hypothetical protein
VTIQAETRNTALKDRFQSLGGMPVPGRIPSIISSASIGALLLIVLFLLLGKAGTQAAPPSAPHTHPPSAIVLRQQAYTPVVTITLPAPNAVLTTTHLPTYPVHVAYHCGTLCIGSALLDMVSVTVDGGVTYHEAVSDSMLTRYVYTWPIPAEDYVSHTLIARGRNLWGKIGSSNPVSAYVDTIPPQEATITAPTYTENTTFTVSWSATDGSGVVKYDLQYRRDDQGAWTDWLTGSGVTSQTFAVSPQAIEEGHNYRFRMSARDMGSNRSEWVVSTVRAGHYRLYLPAALRGYPPPVVNNGGFETGDLTNWQHGGELDQSVSSDRPHGGMYSAVLGSPLYENDSVPEGSAWVYQTIKVPDSGTPTLSFWYRIFSCDVMWSEHRQSYYDYLDVVLEDTSGNRLESLLRDGFTGEWQPNTLQDLGWRQRIFDLSAYKGQTIRIRFANFNTSGAPKDPDPGLNTYTYLDDIAVEGGR